jgi:hypothetical protein
MTEVLNSQEEKPAPINIIDYNGEPFPPELFFETKYYTWKCKEDNYCLYPSSGVDSCDWDYYGWRDTIRDFRLNIPILFLKHNMTSTDRSPPNAYGLEMDKIIIYTKLEILQRDGFLKDIDPQVYGDFVFSSMMRDVERRQKAALARGEADKNNIVLNFRVM